jgi:hypothetical protein
MAIKKNTASQYITVFAYDSTDGTPKTGDADNITAYIDIDADGGTVTNDTNPTEIDATNMPGAYQFLLTQAETNGDMLTLVCKSSTSNIEIHPFVGYTEVLADYKATSVGLTAAAIDAILQEAIADHKSTAGSLAEFINNISAMIKNKLTFTDGNTTVIYDTDGSTPLFTLTYTDGVGRLTT